MRKLSIAIAMACLLPSALYAYTKPFARYVQTQLTDKDGLPQNSVSSIAQTSDGYMWFGTEEGLARFDGVRFTVLSTRTNRDLKDNYINSLVAARGGGLWVATRTGLLHYKDGKFTNIFPAKTPISAIFESADGRLWVATQQKLFAIEHGNVRLYAPKDGLPNSNVRSITQDSGGTLWFASAQGLVSLRGDEFHRYTSQDGLLDDSVTRVAASRDGSLWLASAKGLERWRGKVVDSWGTKSLPSQSRIASLIEDHNGAVWLGFEHGGIASLQNGKISQYFSKDGLPSDEIQQIYEDRGGHLWIGLLEGGVAELREGLFNTFGDREGLSENMVWSVLEAHDGTRWIGTNAKGLNHVLKDGSVRVYTTRDGLPQGGVDGLAESSDGSIWVGSQWGALTQIKDGQIRTFRYPEIGEARLAGILDAGNGDLWLLFHQVNGLVKFHDGHFQRFEVPGLPNTGVLTRDGSLWIGSDHGGVTNFNHGVLSNYTTQSGLLSNFAQAVYVDREGTVWAGTSPGGLNRIKNGHVTTYSLEQGLFDLTVGSIIEDDFGNLWMSCNRGIFRVSKQELNDYAAGRIKKVHSFVYGKADGMRVAECNFGDLPSVWKTQAGHLLYATPAGVAEVDPGEEQARLPSPPVLVEGVLSDGKPIAFANGAKDGPGSSNFEIQFSAPDFIAPDRLQFRYHLTGFDSEWSYAGDRRQAFYTRVPPGDYQFEVQGSRDGDTWDSQPTTLKLTVTPHFWQTRVFRGLCGAGLALLAISAYRMRTRSLVRRNTELETRVSERTVELKKATEVAEAAREALREQATKDSLTKLWNRRSIFEILGHEMERADREHHSVCLLMADLDYFKELNDTYGHLAGDCVIQTVAHRITNHIRPYDAAGRYGGEEFLIVLSSCTLEEGLERAEELRQIIEQSAVMYKGLPLKVTCSFGVAANYSGALEELLADADEALYKAKRAGRNRVHGPTEQTI